MGNFFSTASRSPRPGDIGTELLDLDLRRDSFEASQEQTQNTLLRNAMAEARNKKLSQSLLGLEDVSKEGVQLWAQENQVTAQEFDSLKPILEQKLKPIKYLNKENEREYWQENPDTGEKFNIVKKDKTPKRYLNKENEHATWQENPETGERINYQEKKGPKKEYGAVLKDENDNRYQISPEGKRVYIDQPKGITEQYSPVMTDETGREYQTAPNGKREYLPSTGQEGLNKVAPWYNTMTKDIRNYYTSGNFEPTAVQQANIDRATSRTYTLVNKISQEQEITQAEAYPIAVSQITKERNVSRVVDETLPAANKGFSSNQQETTLLVKDMINNQVPTYLIGEQLLDKGWTDQEVSEILNTAARLIPASQAGIDLQTLRQNMPKQGYSVLVNGKRWTREGNYLINKEGDKVSINGR